MASAFLDRLSCSSGDNAGVFSGTYLSGINILPGVPKILSIVSALYLIGSVLDKVDRTTSGVPFSLGLSALSISTSSRALALPCKRKNFFIFTNQHVHDTNEKMFPSSTTTKATSYWKRGSASLFRKFRKNHLFVYNKWENLDSGTLTVLYVSIGKTGLLLDTVWCLRFSLGTSLLLHSPFGLPLSTSSCTICLAASLW